jgi:hypothetical protein
MDWHLKQGKKWPGSPSVRVEIGADGVPVAEVKADRQREVDSVAVYYGLGERMPQARYWRSPAGDARDNHGRYKLPVHDSWQPLLVFANVTYKGGICLSSDLVQVIPAQLGKAKATLLPSLDLEQRFLEDWFFTSGYTDPSRDDTYLQREALSSLPAHLTLNPKLFGDPMNFTLSSHLVSDPQFQGPPGAAYSFECRGAFTRDGLTVIAYQHDWSPRARSFTAKVTPAELAASWRTVTLPPERFTGPAGERLTAWADVQRMEIRGAAARSAPPCFRDFRWVLPGTPAPSAKSGE